MCSPKLDVRSSFRLGTRLVGLLILTLLPISSGFAQKAPCSEAEAQLGKPLSTPIDGYPTPLLKAIKLRDLECVKFLLAAGADPNEPRNPNELTATHPTVVEAVLSHRLDILSAVVEAGADIEARSSVVGLTPLTLATFNASQSQFRGDIELVRYLLARGAQVDRGKTDGYTPLMFAAEGGRLELVELLFNAGADINGMSNSGYTPLFAAGDYPEVVEFLLSHGAKFETRPVRGYTIMCDAIWRKHTMKVAILIKHGAAADSACSSSSEP